jgi:hypothetical protein
MITMSQQVRSRPGASRPGVWLAMTALAMTALVSACSSGGHTAASGPATQQTCQRVSTVLSDGPDPDADPVGYAEAQILPLKQIHASDPTLARAISALAGAYGNFFATGGTSQAKAALSAASKKIDSVCPGATS